MTGGVKTSRPWRGVGAEATSANRVVKRIMRMEVVNEVMTVNKRLVETISEVVRQLVCNPWRYL
jgi:hypothetical protein